VYHVDVADRIAALEVAAGALLGTLNQAGPSRWFVAVGRGRDFARLVENLITTLAGVTYQASATVRSEWNRTKPLDATPLCVGCGGPHPFDTSLPSPLWNRVIRGAGLPDYLCTTCIVRAFVLAGEGFTAELWGDVFKGVPIEVRVRSTVATAAADLGHENTALRAALGRLRDEVWLVLDEVTRPTVQSRATPGEQDQ